MLNSVLTFLKNTVNTFLSFIKIIIRSKFSLTLPTTNEETCIVLGNGPSLQESLQKHALFIQKHSLFCLNSFSLSEEYVQLKPSYYVLLDSGFWLSNQEYIIQTLYVIKEKTRWNMQLFVPSIAKKERFIEIEKANPCVKVVYFNYTVFNGFEKIAHFIFSKNLAMPQSQNIIVATLFLSINIGFKNIYLLGADHSWHQNIEVSQDNILLIKDVHFYEQQEKITFRPFYKGAHLKETFKMYEIFNAWSKVFYGYIALNKYAEYRNCKIINSSEISFIDAFKRIKL